jgi:hypothetical protein
MAEEQGGMRRRETPFYKSFSPDSFTPRTKRGVFCFSSLVRIGYERHIPSTTKRLKPLCPTCWCSASNVMQEGEGRIKDETTV